MVKISPSIAGDSALIPGQELISQHVFQKKKKKSKALNRNTIVSHSIKASKMVHIKKKFFKKYIKHYELQRKR